MTYQDLNFNTLEQISNKIEALQNELTEYLESDLASEFYYVSAANGVAIDIDKLNRYYKKKIEMAEIEGQIMAYIHFLKYYAMPFVHEILANIERFSNIDK